MKGVVRMKPDSLYFSYVIAFLNNLRWSYTADTYSVWAFVISLHIDQSPKAHCYI